MIRVAVVGLGPMGRRHVAALARIPEVAIVAGVDPHRDRCVAVGLAWADSLDGVAGDVDAVVVAAPTSAHRDWVMSLIAAGIPCLIEKPLATSAADAEAVRAFADAAGVFVAVGHSERFNPGVEAAARWLATADGAAALRVDRWAVASQHDVAEDLLVHDVDWVLQAMGSDPEEVEVSEFRHRSTQLDAVTCTLTFSGGRQVRLSADGTATSRRRAATLVDSGGTRELSLEPPPPGPNDALTRQARAFLDAVAGRPSAVATAADAVRTISVIDEIRGRCAEMATPS